MRINVLYDLEKLFENRREFIVVAALKVNGPMRFSALAFEVSQYARAKVPDSTITRILVRLMHRGLVETIREHGHDAYQLTAEGQKKGTIIEAITYALDSCQNHRATTNAPAHDPPKAA